MENEVFAAQARFMRMSNQEIGDDTFALYMNLIREEMAELEEAVSENDDVEIFDALCDLIVVISGAGVAKDLPMSEGMSEVYRSNFSKFDRFDKPWKVRADGKILKDEHFSPPNLRKVMADWGAK